MGGLIIYFVVPLYFVLLSAPEKGGRVTIKFTSENPRLARPALLICPRRLAELGGAGHRAPAPARPGSPKEGAGAGGRWCESLGPGAQGLREAAAPDWRREGRGRGAQRNPLPSRSEAAGARPRRPGHAGEMRRGWWLYPPPPPPLFLWALSCLCVGGGRVDKCVVQGR